jgi:hypothetical protein
MGEDGEACTVHPSKTRPDSRNGVRPDVLIIALLLTKLPVPPEEKQGEPTRNPDIAVQVAVVGIGSNRGEAAHLVLSEGEVFHFACSFHEGCVVSCMISSLAQNAKGLWNDFPGVLPRVFLPGGII